MTDEIVSLSVLYATLKKLAAMKYVSGVRKVDNTIVVTNKDGTEDSLQMIKGEKGDTGQDYNHDVARDSMNVLIEEYKAQELSEVLTVLEGVDGN